MAVTIKSGVIRVKRNNEWEPLDCIAPEKGIDYLTPEEIQDLVYEILEFIEPEIDQKIIEIPFDEWTLEIDGTETVKKVLVKPNE